MDGGLASAMLMGPVILVHLKHAIACTDDRLVCRFKMCSRTYEPRVERPTPSNSVPSTVGEHDEEKKTTEGPSIGSSATTTSPMSPLTIRPTSVPSLSQAPADSPVKGCLRDALTLQLHAAVVHTSAETHGGHCVPQKGEERKNHNNGC